MTDPQGKGPNQSHADKPDHSLPSTPNKPDNTLPKPPNKPGHDLPSTPNRPGQDLPNPPNRPDHSLPNPPNKPGHDLPNPPNKPTHPDHNPDKPTNPIQPSHPELPGNKPDWKPEPKSELTDEEKKGLKRLGTPLTQDKAVSLGQTDKNKANMELNVDPRARSDSSDSKLPKIESDRNQPQTEEEKFINQDNPDFSPGYMHDHNAKVSQDDKVEFTQTDKSSTVRVPPRARFPFQIPEPLIGNEVPNPQILPQNKEDLLTTIRSILKVTSADSQQLEIALDRIATLIPATYTPRSIPNRDSGKPSPFDDSSKRAMTTEEYNRNKNRSEDLEYQQK